MDHNYQVEPSRGPLATKLSLDRLSSSNRPLPVVNRLSTTSVSAALPRAPQSSCTLGVRLIQVQMHIFSAQGITDV